MRGRVGESLQSVVVACSILCLSSGAAIRPQKETAEAFDRVKKAIQQDDWGRAKSGIGHALSLTPKSAEAHFVAAQVYWHEGARSMAIEALEKAIEYQPVYPEAHLLLARCLAACNNLGKAREEVMIAIAQGVSGFPANRLLGELDIAKDDFPAAISSLETALRYSTIDDGDTNRVREQVSGLREFTEKVARFAELEERQKGPDIVQPVLVNSVGPRYPEEARRLKIQGTVGMVIIITEQGDVDSVLISRSLGHGLDEEATEMARKLKFSPATQSDKPIRYLKRLSIEFNLR